MRAALLLACAGFLLACNGAERPPISPANPAAPTVAGSGQTRFTVGGTPWLLATTATLTWREENVVELKTPGWTIELATWEESQTLDQALAEERAANPAVIVHHQRAVSPSEWELVVEKDAHVLGVVHLPGIGTSATCTFYEPSTPKWQPLLEACKLITVDTAKRD